VKVVLQGCAEYPKTNWIDDETRNPEDVETILGLPYSVVKAPCQSERDAVVQNVSENESDYNTDPMAEGKCSVLLECETVATFCDGFLEPDGCQSVDADVKPEGDQSEDAHNDSHWTNSN
jgi:hypothetical protein